MGRPIAGLDVIRVSGCAGSQYRSAWHTSSVSVYAVKRETKKGARWYVRAELPGLAMIHLGTFDTEKRAKTRIRDALDEIAAGRVPVRFKGEDAPSSRTLARAATEWIAVRHDLSDVTRIPYERMIREWPADLSSL